MNGQMKRHSGRGLGGSQAQELLSPWSWGVSSSLYVDVLANLEALQTPYYWDCVEASSCRYDQLTPLPVPLPSLEDEKWG